MDNVRRLTVEGKEVILIGTAHVSRKSVEEVGRVLAEEKPETVCIELCEPRFKALTEPGRWKEMDLFKVIKEGRSIFLLSQLLISGFYRRIGQQLGVTPGAEMIEGAEWAKKNKAALVLADRDVQITLKRTWGALSFWHRMKLAFLTFSGLFDNTKLDEKSVEALKEKDQLESALGEVAKAFPTVKASIIDERDVFLSQKIREAPGKKIAAVLGAGHLDGVAREIQKVTSLEPLLTVPPPSFWGKAMKWSIPGAIAALFIYGFFHADLKSSLTSIYIWTAVTGSLAGLGAALALAHPIAIASAFITAPLTTLHPALAAGWFSGLAQAWVKKPTVADLELLPEAVTTFRGLWRNKASRVLLVVVLSNIGSALGSFVAGGWIAARSLSAH